jgi:hypothetical protein
VLNEKITQAFARQKHGVVLSADGLSVDETATEAARKEATGKSGTI